MRTPKQDTIAALAALLQAMQPEQDANGAHSHKCPDCGYIWSHENSCVNDEPAHTCRCGTVNWWVFHEKREGHWQSCANL